MLATLMNPAIPSVAENIALLELNQVFYEKYD